MIKDFQTYTFNNGEEETNLYFFHTDHLGSTNYLTDKDGVVQQSLVYMPYGEILSETKTYSNPYKFNGKELDTETGLAYYGARYYSPELSVWYGVDPLMEKYPNSSPYVFCAGNPVKYIDPDGRKFMDSSKEYVDKFKKVITDKLASLNNNLNELTSKNKVSAKKIERVQEQINEVNTASKELSVLEKSDQLYSIQIGIPRAFKKEDTNLYGSTFYNIGTDAVTVGIDVSLDINSDEFIGALAHELKHCFQFEIGELTFSKNGGAGIAYDFNDEVAAHKRGGLFGASRSYPDGGYRLLDKADKSIYTTKKDLLSDNYYKAQKIIHKPILNKK